MKSGQRSQLAQFFSFLRVFRSLKRRKFSGGSHASFSACFPFCAVFFAQPSGRKTSSAQSFLQKFSFPSVFCANKQRVRIFVLSSHFSIQSEITVAFSYIYCPLLKQGKRYKMGELEKESSQKRIAINLDATILHRN